MKDLQFDLLLFLIRFKLTELQPLIHAYVVIKVTFYEFAFK